MRVPTFHIFSGFRDKDALWLESVEGLGAANERMKQLGAEDPGPYFVFLPIQTTFSRPLIRRSIATSKRAENPCNAAFCARRVKTKAAIDHYPKTVQVRASQTVTFHPIVEGRL